MPHDPTVDRSELRVARVFCTLYYSLEDYTSPGMYYEHDTRGNLKRFDQQFRQDHNGLHLRVGLEPEMLWLKPKAGEVRPYEGITEAFAYHIGQFEQARHIWKQVSDYALAMGVTLVYTVAVYALNTLVDVAYALIDPRVELEKDA